MRWKEGDPSQRKLSVALGGAFGAICGCSVGGGAGEEGRCENFEAGCLSQMSQVQGELVTGGEMRTSFGPVWLGVGVGVAGLSGCGGSCVWLRVRCWAWVQVRGGILPKGTVKLGNLSSGYRA